MSSSPFHSFRKMSRSSQKRFDTNANEQWIIDDRIPLLPRKPQRRARRIRVPMYTLRNDGGEQARFLLGVQCRG
jgi:hypothetical protein